MFPNTAGLCGTLLYSTQYISVRPVWCNISCQNPPPRLFDSSAIVILQIFITMTWKQGHLFVDVMNVYECL